MTQERVTALSSDVKVPAKAQRPHALVVTFGPIVDPRGGWGVRARSVVDALDELGLRTAVISHSERPGAQSASIDALHVLKRKLHLGWSWELVRAVRRRAPQADVIVVESALLLPAVQIARPTAPIVWDTTECETLHYSRTERTWNHRLRGLVWREIERWAVKQTDVVVAISDTELLSWTRLFPASREKLVVVAHQTRARPNLGVEARRGLEDLCERPLTGPVALFVGNLAAKHNVAAASWLMLDLAPQLSADCTLVLAGPGTEKLATRGDRRVVCLGGVPDIDLVIAAADVCLAPLAAGAGVKTKVLDYLAHGKVVLATPVAMEGLEGAPGVYTTDLDSFATRLLDLLRHREDDEALSRRVASQRAWVRARHGPEQVAYGLRVALERAGVALP